LIIVLLILISLFGDWGAGKKKRKGGSSNFPRNKGFFKKKKNQKKNPPPPPPPPPENKTKEGPLEIKQKNVQENRYYGAPLEYLRGTLFIFTQLKKKKTILFLTVLIAVGKWGEFIRPSPTPPPPPPKMFLKKKKKKKKKKKRKSFFF